MKTYIKRLMYVGLGIGLLTSCSEDIDTVAEIRDNAGVVIEVSSQSSAGFFGSPEADVDLGDANVDITEATVSFTATQVAGSLENSNIARLEIVKTVAGSEEVVVGETNSLPYTVTLEGVDEFLEGTGLSQSDLRIGDALTLRVRAIMNNGEVYYYNTGMGRFAVNLNCSYDLSGTYRVTNSHCGTGSSGTIPLVQITQNSDGTWFAETADGGLLQYCTQNTAAGFQQVGSFAVSCGGVVDVSNTDGGPAYCGSNGIGCITGGSWNQDTGVLELTHNDTFFGIGEYTSTYVRQ